MTTTTYIFVTGTKGGVGTTALVTMLGLDLAGADHLVALQSADREDLLATLGMPITESPLVTTNVRFGLNVVLLEETAHGYDYVIVDCGTTEPEQFASMHLLPWTPNRLVISTLDNSYNSIRIAARTSADAFVCLFDSHRALTRMDIDAAIGQPVTLVERSPQVARALDAGVLVMRAPGNSVPRTIRTIGRRCEDAKAKALATS